MYEFILYIYILYELRIYHSFYELKKMYNDLSLKILLHMIFEKTISRKEYLVPG